MKLFSLLLFLIGILVLTSCNESILKFTNEDKSQTITVITLKKEKIRYVINGDVSTVPDTNFVKIDIDNIDSLGDGIWGCWDKNGYTWEVCVHGSKVIESKLDTTNFKFNTSLPTKEFGIPTQEKYVQESCFVFDFTSNRIYNLKYDKKLK